MLSCLRRTAVAVWLLIGAGSVSAEVGYELILPAVSHHFDDPVIPGKRWNEFHDGLGLSRTDVRDSFVLRAFGGFIRDSFDKQGLYFGAAASLRLIDRDIALDIGIAPMMLYRTTRFDSATRGKAPHRWIPVALPVASIEHRATGIGAHISLLPGGNFGKEMSFPALALVQFWYRLQ
jgi:hypothetical protein